MVSNSIIKALFTYVSPFVLCLTLLGLLSFMNLKAQSEVELFFYTDLGETNASDGFYVRSAGIGAYRLGKYRMEGGLQIDLKSASSNTITGSKIALSREFTIKDFSFETQGLFQYNTFSKNVHEINWGIVFGTKGDHFYYRAGVNFRTFKVTRKAIEDHNIQSNKSIHEKWNLMYLLGYNLKPMNNPWNIGITLTNIDHFIINQETNPVFYLTGKYQLSTPMTLYAEVWYKSAGAFNISVNSFGYFIRTGIRWTIDTDT